MKQIIKLSKVLASKIFVQLPIFHERNILTTVKICETLLSVQIVSEVCGTVLLTISSAAATSDHTES